MGKDTVKSQPLLIGALSDYVPEVSGIGITRVQSIKHAGCTNRNLSKFMIFTVRYEGLKRRGDPLGISLAHKNRFSEFNRLRKVD